MLEQESEIFVGTNAIQVREDNQLTDKLAFYIFSPRLAKWSLAVHFVKEVDELNERELAPGDQIGTEDER